MNIWEDNKQLKKLRLELFEEYYTGRNIKTKCPFCNTVPQTVIENEFELLVECQCGKLSFGEKY